MIPKSLLTLALLCFVFCIPAPTHAQDSDPIGKVYFATAEPLPDDWQGGWGETADIIWELDTATGTTRELLRIEPRIEQTPRETFSEHEFGLLEQEAQVLLGGMEMLDHPIYQGLEALALLDAERLLVVTRNDMRHTMMGSDIFYGFYGFQILNLGDGSLNSLLTVDYHTPLMFENWNCGSSGVAVSRDIRPNPIIKDLFAFSISPYDYVWCSSQSIFLIDYSTLPVQIEIIPNAGDFSWSPDGSMIAYSAGSCMAEDCFTEFYVRSVTAGAEPRLIAQHEPGGNYASPYITWLNSHTVVYEYMEYDMRHPEVPLLAGHELLSDETIFTEDLIEGEIHDLDYLYDGQTVLVYGWNRAGIVLLRITDHGELDKYQTLFRGAYLYQNSCFRHVGLLRWGTGNSFLVIHPDLHTSRLDLSPYIPEGHSLTWVISGAAEE